MLKLGSGAQTVSTTLPWALPPATSSCALAARSVRLHRDRGEPHAGLGHSVTTLMQGIKLWSEEHINEVLDARDAYDVRAAQEPRPVSA